MSVINKMLRDLDQRQGKNEAHDLRQARLHHGTAALTGSTGHPGGQGAKRRNGPRHMLALLGLVVILALAGGAWWAQQRVTPVPVAAVSPPAVLAMPVAVPAAPASAVAAAASAAPIEPVAVQAPAAPAPATVLPPPKPAEPATPPVAATAAVTLPAAPPPVPAGARREPAALGLRMETTLTPRRPAERAERQPGSERAPSTASSDVPKGPTPNEALERAQTLWNTGAREAAIDLLQDAVGVAERAGAGAAYPQGNPVLLPLVRELTRLQLAESRHGAVWDVLTRLEPQLGTASDLWAIRGNVAQRLGRHQDSVHAYMVALQSRPNEQRWLLGAAVSLAALGQTSSAADMADKARAVGVVSPDVLAYLRQMGVPLKDK